MDTRLRIIIWTLVALAFCGVGYSLPFSFEGDCGDANGDGDGPNVVDLTYFVSYLFAAGEPPPELNLVDVDGSGTVNIADLTYYVSYLFAGGPALSCPVSMPSGVNSGYCLSSYVARDDLWSESFSSGCIWEKAGVVPNGSMFAQLIGMDLHVYHDNAHYNCCMGYMADYNIYGSSILVQEIDTGTYCYCECAFNLQSVLHGLNPPEPTEFEVTLRGLEGDTVGVDSIWVGGEERLKVDVSDNSVYVNHLNAYYQCCLGYQVDYVIGSGIIVGQELDTAEFCDCYCTFNLQSVIDDVPNGTYEFILIGINGDTVGSQIIDVGQKTYLVDYDIFPCAPPDSGIVSIILWGTGTTMEDATGRFACNADIEMDFERAGDTLRYFEYNRNSEPDTCTCFFLCRALARPVDIGEYVVEIWRQYDPAGPVELVYRETRMVQ